VISLDTLRADRLGSYGYHRETSPVIDAFGAKGARFEHAVAECSWTLPSHVTMLTGLFPSSHGVLFPDDKVGEDTPLLAELLKQAGFKTHAIVGGGYVDQNHGFDRGFDAFMIRDENSLDVVVREAIAHLQSIGPDERSFLFLHTYATHCPYDPSPEFAALFQSADAEAIETAGRCGNPDYNRMSLSPGQVRHISDKYDSSIREADALLAPLFHWLDKRGFLMDTAVVITSDHGEEFYEHGQIGHERTLYRELLAIPLFIVAPGVEPATVQQSAGLVDLVPTALRLLGVDAPTGLDGADLLAPTARDPAVAARVSELEVVRRLRSIMTREAHLIINLDQGTHELYRIQEDPREAWDVAGEAVNTVAELRAQLTRYEQSITARTAERASDPSLEEMERLRRLGYVQ
jgi:arylsulfatase A-like enzyme